MNVKVSQLKFMKILFIFNYLLLADENAHRVDKTLGQSARLADTSKNISQRLVKL